MLKFVKLRNLLPCKRALSSVTCDVTNSTHSLLGLVRYLRCCRNVDKERERELKRERGEWESDRQAGRPHISKRVAAVARIYFSTDARASRRRRSAAATDKRTKDETTAKNKKKNTVVNL